jgi:hypothetical protein
MRKFYFIFSFLFLMAVFFFAPFQSSAWCADPSNRPELDPNHKYLTYINHMDGYQINYPSRMMIDDSMTAIRTVFTSADTRIEIYYDDFTGSLSVPSVYSYINYSNRFTQNTEYHRVQEDRFLTLNGFNVHILSWNRDKLPRIPDDKNYYVSAEIIKNNQEVYTIFFKSTDPITNYMEILSSFQLRDKSDSSPDHIKFAPLEKNWNEETTRFYQEYFVDNQSLTWGVFEYTAPEEDHVLNEIQHAIDYRFPLLLKYQMLDNPFPLQALQKAYEDNRYVELTLQTFWLKLSDTRNEKVVYEILGGKYDLYFQNYAQQLKSFGHPVLFRLNNEMNGDWCKYSSYYTSKDPEIFTAMWRHVYNIFAAEGVDNVIWVWNPHDVSFPNYKLNHALTYYPGDQYVDLIGLTGYNTGNYYAGETWREFEQIYDPLYQSYSEYFSHPFIITEFGSNSVGGDKSAWVKNMFAHIYKYPQIKAAIWWNGIDWDQDMQPARIYRMDESPSVLKAFREGLNERPVLKAEINQPEKTDLLSTD